MATMKKSIKKAQNGIKTGNIGYDPNTKIEDKSKQKESIKFNSEGEPYRSKYKEIGYELDKEGKPTNPTLRKYKVDDSGKTIKKFTKSVSMERAKRNVRRVLGEDAPEAMKKGGTIKKKMKNGGSLTGMKSSNKRVGPVDPKGAFTKVQKRTLTGAKGKASLTKDKQLGATKMAKMGAKMSKKK